MAVKKKVGPLARFSLAIILVVAALLIWSFFTDNPGSLGIVSIAFLCTGIVGSLASAELLRLHQRIDELQRQAHSHGNNTPAESEPPKDEQVV